MGEVKTVVCIICPLGCKINVKITGEDNCVFEGNRCKNGSLYAKEEITNPTRMLTTTLCIHHGESERISVRTNKTIPKNEVPEYMRAIKRLKIEAPVRNGEVIARNLFDTDICIIATKSVARNG